MAEMNTLSRTEQATLFLRYEIVASWWAPWINGGRLQDLAVSYFAWKERRKMRRLREVEETNEMIDID